MTVDDWSVVHDGQLFVLVMRMSILEESDTNS